MRFKISMWHSSWPDYHSGSIHWLSIIHFTSFPSSKSPNQSMREKNKSTRLNSSLHRRSTAHFSYWTSSSVFFFFNLAFVAQYPSPKCTLHDHFGMPLCDFALDICATTYFPAVAAHYRLSTASSVDHGSSSPRTTTPHILLPPPPLQLTPWRPGASTS